MKWPRRLLDIDAPSRAVLAMAVALFAGWALGRAALVPFAADSLAQAIMARTPPDLANALLLRVGDLARPFALLGGIATYLGFAVGLGLPYALIRPRSAAPATTFRGGSAITGRRARPCPPLSAHLLSAALALIWPALIVALALPWPPNLALAGAFAATLAAVYVAGRSTPAVLPKPRFRCLPGTYLRLRKPPLRVPSGPDPLSTLRQGSDLSVAPEVGVGGVGRRPLLKGLAVSSAAVLVMANVAFFDAFRRGAAGRGRGGRVLFAWWPPPARAPGFDLAGLPPEVTPISAFYRMSKNVVDPDLDGTLWRLTVGNRRWSLAELQELPRVDRYCTLRCISNRVDTTLMSTALFSGVRLRDLLAASGVALVGDGVVCEGSDGHHDSIPVAAASDDDTLIVWAMNGRELTRDHGYPARLLIPGRYGFKNVKWLHRIRISPAPYTGTWQALGWTRDALVKTMSRIDAAARGPEGVTVAGVAFAGGRGISAVRVRFDDGPWLDAEVHLPALDWATWVQWRVTGPALARVATVRAVDGDGNEQPVEERPQFPDGAQGLHRITIG